jgi:hypothetical protein
MIFAGGKVKRWCLPASVPVPQSTAVHEDKAACAEMASVAEGYLPGLQGNRPGTGCSGGMTASLDG